jgi:hypothetical protein
VTFGFDAWCGLSRQRDVSDSSDAETEATTWSLADTEHASLQLEREIYGITLNEQKWVMMEFSIRLIKFQASCGTICIQALRKIIEKHVLPFSNPKLHPVSHILDSIRQMGSGHRFSTDISERLHIPNVKDAS